MYSRKSVKVPANTSFEWNVVAGRQRPRCTVRGRGRGISRGTPRPKRQRISTGSGSSVAEASTQESCLFDSIPLDSFKTMNIDDKLESIFVYLQDMRLTNQRLLKAEQTVRDLHDHTRVNSRRIDILAYKSIDVEARQRRNNLIFWGIPEFVNEDCMTTLREFFADKLDLDPESISIQRIHRIGRRQHPGRTRANQATQNKHRPLIALFRDYQDVELILSNAGKLRGTRFCINRDYPQEIINARKPLLALKRELKSQNPSSRISIQYPAKLIKDGQIIRDMFPDWQQVMRKSRLTYIADGDDDNAVSGQVRSGGKASGMNVFVSGHSSDNSDFEQPDTDQDCQFSDTQTQISRSQPMEHPNERPGTVTENDPDQNRMDVSQPNETPQQAV